MQINELAALLGVSASTLRHWEKKLELSVPRDELGQRTYPPDWQEYFRQVKALLDGGKNYEEIKGELPPPGPQEPEPPAEPPAPVTPPAELEEMKAAIARLEAGLLQTGEEVGAGKAALVRAGERIDVMRKDLTQTVDDVVGVSRKLAKVDERSETVRADVEGVHTEIDGLRGDVKKAADAAEGAGQKVAELAERVAQLQDGAGNGDVAGLQAAIKEIDAELKGCNKSLKQAQKAIEGLQEVQAGTADEIAGLQKQITGLQGAPGLSEADLQALKTFRERFWWYMGAIVFLFMVLTISVVEGIR
ncbi:MAG: MerR family transcriptional regulator [Polynucleobacter sp.]|nr:MerR family transcriptional regulator [Polynucleobacter sp.]